MPYHHGNGQMYSVSFSSADATGVITDIFQITASTQSNIRLHEIRFARIAAALSSSAIETLSVLVRRGSTESAAGGVVDAAVNLDGRSDVVATFAVLNNSTTPGSSVGDLLYSKPWNTQEDFIWRPDPEQRPVCKLNQRLQVRLGAPAGTIVFGGTIIVEEIGKAPGLADK